MWASELGRAAGRVILEQTLSVRLREVVGGADSDEHEGKHAAACGEEKRQRGSWCGMSLQHFSSPTSFDDGSVHWKFSYLWNYAA